MPTFREDPAAYMRARRARQKAEREAASQTVRPVVIDRAIPRNALSKASAAEVATVRAKVAGIGPGAVITKTDGRFDVVSREAFEARQKMPAPPSHQPSRPPAPRRAEPPDRGRELAVYKPLPATPSMVAGKTVKPAPKHAQGMVASGGTPPGPPLDIVITHWQLGHLIQTRDADLAEIAAWKRAYELERNHTAELEREKSAKAASQAKWWAEAQRLFFNMIRPQPL
jgi:hypothetical protein